MTQRNAKQLDNIGSRELVSIQFISFILFKQLEDYKENQSEYSNRNGLFGKEKGSDIDSSIANKQFMIDALVFQSKVK